MRTRIVVLGVFLLAGCQKSPGSDEASVRQQSDDARAAVADINARWVRYTHANQPDSLATLYTPDGIAMPPDVPAAVGPDSIVARMRTLIVPGGKLTITSQNVSVSGPIAVSRGVWTYTAPAQGGNPAINLTGKYIEHLHNVNGRWLIAENIWNTDTPTVPPPMAPAARRGR